MSASPNWTKEELDVLKEAYPRLGRCKELQDLFPTRPLQGIALKANRMGYKVTNNIRRGRSNEEYLGLCEQTNFIPLEKYKGSTTPIKHMCGICEYEWKARPQHILRTGAKCPICSHRDRLLTVEDVDKVLNTAGFSRLSPYIGALSTLKIKHDYCGYEWDTVYSYIQQGSGCPLCNRGFGSQYSNGTLPETATIYLLEVNTAEYTCYKIGVTSRSISTRIRELKSRIPSSIVELKVVYLTKDSGLNILRKEKLVLSSFLKFQPCKRFEGSTELLDKSIDINLVKEIMNENI